MSEQRLSGSLQESVLTLICMDDGPGALAANIIDPALFEEPYDDIARRAIEFRRQYKKAPGEAHLDDIFDHVIDNPKHKKHKLYQLILGQIVQLADTIKPDYVLARISKFMRAQNINASLLKAVERIELGGDDATDEAETILHEALRFKPQGIERGRYLSDTTAVAFLSDYGTPDYVLGIPELDRRGIGLYKGDAMGFLAPKGKGKTTACVHVGVVALQQSASVLHISLEMEDKQVLPKYYRRLFAIGRTREKHFRTNLVVDDLNRVIGLKPRQVIPQLALTDRDIESKVAAKIARFGPRLGRLHFKSFPSSRLTIGQLTAFLDNLEMSDGFVPDVLILDYPKLMKLDRRQDLRIGLGLMMEELRGLCGERRMAGFFPMQSNREGEDIPLITGKHIGEDYSLGQTVDALLTYNQTKAEHRLGLARISVEKARGQPDGYVILITQDYDTGQFVLGSAYMPNDYFNLVKDLAGDQEDGE